MRQLVRADFVLARWVCTAENVFGFVRYPVHPEPAMAMVGPTMRIALAPLLIEGAQIARSFSCYRFDGAAVRLAGSTGLVRLLIVPVQPLRTAVGVPIGVAGTWLYVYFAHRSWCTRFWGPQ